MQEFNDFIQRIENLNGIAFPKPLLKCVKKSALLAIVDDLLTNKRRLNRLKKLAPNQALRVSKNVSGLARTFCVLRDYDGKYRCILETKSKNAQNKKYKVQKAKGASKSGKPSWRLDGKNGPTPYFSLVVPLRANVQHVNLKTKAVAEELGNLKAEIDFPWSFPKDSGLQRNTLGPAYVNKRGLNICVYSKKGVPMDCLAKNDIKLTDKEHKEIAVSLLETITLIHQQKMVYQDIKPDNILLFRKPNGKIKVRLSDPGGVYKSNEKRNDEAFASHPYESPEIALAHSKPSGFSDYFQSSYKEFGMSLAKPTAKKLATKLLREGGKRKLATVRSDYLKPHPANDMWALGVSLFRIFNHDELPTKIPTDSKFAGFFAPRDKRITAEAALKLWKKRTLR